MPINSLGWTVVPLAQSVDYKCCEALSSIYGDTVFKKIPYANARDELKRLGWTHVTNADYQPYDYFSYRVDSFKTLRYKGSSVRYRTHYFGRNQRVEIFIDGKDSGWEIEEHGVVEGMLGITSINGGESYGPYLNSETAINHFLKLCVPDKVHKVKVGV